MTNDRLYPISILQSRPLMNAADLAIHTRYMPSTSAMFSYDQTPYLYDPTAALSDISRTFGVVIKSPAQVGKSTTIENFLAWIVEYDRANTMVILDTQKSAEKMSRNRIRPFLRTRGINNPNNTKSKDPDKSNSVVNIGLGAGANLFLCSAKSPSDLRSTPSKYCAFDEVDAWPDELPGEGDPLQNALQRMMRFRGMYLLTSTPTDFYGRITQNFLLGTQQTWCAVCECGELMECRFDDIDFSNDIPVYTCPKCGIVYNENDIKCLPHRYSDPKNTEPMKDRFGRVLRSYEIYGTLCHHFYSWDYLKQLELSNIKLGEASYQSFRNTRLGEVYKPKDDIDIQPTELMRQCIDRDISIDCLPEDIAGICLGVDTHDDCLYVFTAAFTLDEKIIYGLDYDIIVGNPDEKQVWDELKKKMGSAFTLSDGRVIKPAFCCIDSGGHRTNAVYINTFREPRILAVKGYVSCAKHKADPLVGTLKKYNMNGGIKGKCKVLQVGVNAGKDDLAARCMSATLGDKVLLYTTKRCFDVEYFNGLLSEKKIDGKWRAKSHARNEPLDTFVYALAAYTFWRDYYLLTGKDKENYNIIMRKKKTKQDDSISTIDTQGVKAKDLAASMSEAADSFRDNLTKDLKGIREEAEAIREEAETEPKQEKPKPKSKPHW